MVRRGDRRGIQPPSVKWERWTGILAVLPGLSFLLCGQASAYGTCPMGLL